MIQYEPFWDLAGKTLYLNPDVSKTLEGLLRLQNTKDSQRPITLYIIGSATTLPPEDALMVCSMMRALRSPVRTVGMGVLQHTQPLILAAGTGERHLVQHSVIALSPLKWNNLPCARTPIGLNAIPGTTPVQGILEEEMKQFLSTIKFDHQLFESEQILTASQALGHRLIDSVITKTIQPTTPKKKIHYEMQK